eukprot:RCo017100
MRLSMTIISETRMESVQGRMVLFHLLGLVPVSLWMGMISFSEIGTVGRRGSLDFTRLVLVVSLSLVAWTTIFSMCVGRAARNLDSLGFFMIKIMLTSTEDIQVKRVLFLQRLLVTPSLRGTARFRWMRTNMI